MPTTLTGFVTNFVQTCLGYDLESRGPTNILLGVERIEKVMILDGSFGVSNIERSIG